MIMKAFNLLSALVIVVVEATWFSYDATTCGNTAPNSDFPSARTSQDYAEASQLVQAGLACINNYAVDLVARESLTAYFGIRPNAGFNAPNSDGTDAFDRISGKSELQKLDEDEHSNIAIVESLQAVQSWLNGNLPAYLGQQPLLFCSSQWLQYYAWNVQALDNSGTPRTSLELDGTSSIVTWQQAYPTQYDQGLSLYWSDQLKQVYFIDTEGAGGNYCSIDGNEGLTQTDTTKPPPFTIICPSAYEAPHIQNLGGTGRPTIGTGLDDYLPYSATFYHEMFHLAVGNADTPDLVMDVGEVLEQAEDAAQGDEAALNDLSRDPETFVFMSLDYWYYLQEYGGSNPLPRVSFKTGLAQEI